METMVGKAASSHGLFCRGQLALCYCLISWACMDSLTSPTLLPVFLFGAMGVKRINYGLTMRYLGMSMGIKPLSTLRLSSALMTPIINVASCVNPYRRGRMTLRRFVARGTEL